MTTITYMPIIKLDTGTVAQAFRFSKPTELIAAEDDPHWLYPALSLDLLLDDNGGGIMTRPAHRNLSNGYVGTAAESFKMEKKPR